MIHIETPKKSIKADFALFFCFFNLAAVTMVVAVTPNEGDTQLPAQRSLGWIGDARTSKDT